MYLQRYVLLWIRYKRSCSNPRQQTRSLAREQFLKKALIKKIAKGMALDEYQMR